MSSKSVKDMGMSAVDSNSTVMSCMMHHKLL